MLPCRFLYDLLLYIPERRFSVFPDDVRRMSSRLLFYGHVRVDEAPAESSRDPPADRRLAASRHADEDDVLRLQLDPAQGWLPDLEERFVPEKMLPALQDHVTVRFTYGPQDDLFSAIGKRTFAKSEYTLSDKSDRMGFRMDGPAVERAAGSDGNIISDGICFGAIQITNGQPIVMMADRQTTGGYPKLGCVITADLPLLAQLKAGDRVRFRPVSVAAAQAVYRRQQKALNDFEKKLAARPESESDLETEPSTGRFLIRVNGEEYDIYIEEQSNNA